MSKEPTANELASAAAEIAVHLPELCNIVRPTLADDPYGGQTETDTTIATGVPCRIAPSGGSREQLVASKIADTGVWTAIVPSGTDVRVGDYVIVTTKASFKIRVEAVLSPETYAIATRALGAQVV